jgi:hypothetical protein
MRLCIPRKNRLTFSVTMWSRSVWLTPISTKAGKMFSNRCVMRQFGSTSFTASGELTAGMPHKMVGYARWTI